MNRSLYSDLKEIENQNYISSLKSGEINNKKQKKK